MQCKRHHARNNSMDEDLAAATRAVPPFLLTQDPDALADTLLPVLTKPWPAACEALVRKAGAGPMGPDLDHGLMGGTQLPLLSAPQLVQCAQCFRMVLRDVFEAHRSTCDSLPVESMLEADAMLEHSSGRPQTKSPLRDAMGRPASATGRAHSSASNHRPSPPLKPVAQSGGPAHMDVDSIGQLMPPAKRSRSGPSGSRSGQRPPSAEAEQRRLQFERWGACSSHRPLTTHHSPLTTHRSHLTAHRSHLTAHRSPLTAHRSPLTAHRSPLTTDH